MSEQMEGVDTQMENPYAGIDTFAQALAFENKDSELAVKFARIAEIGRALGTIDPWNEVEQAGALSAEKDALVQEINQDPNAPFQMGNALEMNHLWENSDVMDSIHNLNIFPSRQAA